MIVRVRSKSEMGYKIWEQYKHPNWELYCYTSKSDKPIKINIGEIPGHIKVDLSVEVPEDTTSLVLKTGVVEGTKIRQKILVRRFK